MFGCAVAGSFSGYNNWLKARIASKKNRTVARREAGIIVKAAQELLPKS